MGFSGRFVCFLAVAFMGFLGSSVAYKFYVGGRDGWVMCPSEDYNRWAERNRFQINDTLFFKYKNGTDSVLAVTKEDYLSCDIRNPRVSLTGGDSIFKFGHSGPFFFISGNAECCQKGQKLHIVVMAERHKHVVLPPPPASPPLEPSPKAESPSTESPSPSPKAESPSAESPSDIDSPVPSPAKNSALSGIRASIGFVLCIGIASLLFTCSFL